MGKKKIKIKKNATLDKYVTKHINYKTIILKPYK